MEEKIVIIGAGGFGRHVLSILRSTHNWKESRFIGFLDDGNVRQDRLKKLGAIHLGPTAMLNEISKDTKYVIGIGNGKARENIDTLAIGLGLKPLTVIHPDTSIAEDSVIGEGVVICAGARITTNVTLGRQVHLNMNVTVGHDVEIEDFSTVFPLVAIGGESHIGRRTTVGAGSTINPGVSSGVDSYVAAGAVVTRNIDPATLVAGVPAERRKYLS